MSAFVAYLLSLLSVGSMPDGRFAMAWSAHDGDGLGVVMRIFAADGKPTSPIIPVNQSGGSVLPKEKGSQLMPDVAAWSSGSTNEGFVATWVSLQSDNPLDLSQLTIYARRFDALGSPLGEHIVVDAPPTLPAARMVGYPSVATFPNGSFIVCWSRHISNATGIDSRVWCRAYDNAGLPAPIVDPLLTDPVNITTADFPGMYPRVATLNLADKTGFAVTWERQSSRSPGVYFKRYQLTPSYAHDSAEREALVGGYTGHPAVHPNNYMPDIAFFSDGQLIIADLSNDKGKEKAFIDAVIVDVDGNIGTPFSVTTQGFVGTNLSEGKAPPAGDPMVYGGCRPRVTSWAHKSGEGFFVTWSQIPYPLMTNPAIPVESLGVFGRQYRVDGSAVTEPVRINKYIAEQAVFPVVTSAATGDAAYTVGWVTGRTGKELVGNNWYEPGSTGGTISTLADNLRMKIFFQRFKEDGSKKSR